MNNFGLDLLVHEATVRAIFTATPARSFQLFLVLVSRAMVKDSDDPFPDPYSAVDDTVMEHDLSGDKSPTPPQAVKKEYVHPRIIH